MVIVEVFLLRAPFILSCVLDKGNPSVLSPRLKWGARGPAGTVDSLVMAFHVACLSVSDMHNNAC